MFSGCEYSQVVQSYSPADLTVKMQKKAHIHGNCVLFGVKQVVRNNVFCIHEERSSRRINFFSPIVFAGAVGR